MNIDLSFLRHTLVHLEYVGVYSLEMIQLILTSSCMYILNNFKS